MSNVIGNLNLEDWQCLLNKRNRSPNYSCIFVKKSFYIIWTLKFLKFYYSLGLNSKRKNKLIYPFIHSFVHPYIYLSLLQSRVADTFLVRSHGFKKNPSIYIHYLIYLLYISISLFIQVISTKLSVLSISLSISIYLFFSLSLYLYPSIYLSRGCIFFFLQKYGQISCWGKKWLKADEKKGGGECKFFPKLT